MKKLKWVRACLDWAYCASAFWVSRFHFFFFFFQRLWTVTALFLHMDSMCRRQSALFIEPKPLYSGKKYIKNGSHGNIHTFKNCFATMFSVFSFLQNKLYPNGPFIFWKSIHWLHVVYILNTHVKFCVKWILFTIWCINLFSIHNFKLQKLAI